MHEATAMEERLVHVNSIDDATDENNTPENRDKSVSFYTIECFTGVNFIFPHNYF